MFGFKGDESAGVVARKKGYLHEAQQRWGFLTRFDLSVRKNWVQLGATGKGLRLGRGTG